MPYTVEPLPFDPKAIKGLSEKILTSHYENNYTGAVKRLNAITEQLAGFDYSRAPVFVVNGLKREELIAANSMILHELYFAGLGGESQPGAALADAMARDFGGVERWAPSLSRWAKPKAAGRVG
jgi:Fe-Mn family superoxide dismutase